MNTRSQTNIINLVVYPKKACLELAQIISKLSRNYKLDISHHDFNKPLKLTHPTIFVFPILGDNQLPREVEKCLHSSHFTPKLNCFLSIAGDFDESPEGQHIVKNEAIRLICLQGAQVSYVPLMVDTPIQKSEEIQREIWVDKVLNISSQEKGFSFIPKLDTSCSAKGLEKHDLFQRDEWKHLVGLLKKAPIVSFASQMNDKDLRLTLTDGMPYTRSLISDLNNDQLKEVFTIINQLPSITSLDLSFANLVEWPAETPRLHETLTNLNIRGNLFDSYDFIRKFVKLEKLNIAANNLSHMPEAIFSLSQLKVLYAYKNSIETLCDNLGRLKNLKRLTLYRNLLTTLPTTLSSCKKLEVLNIGGNPILTLSQEISMLPHLKTIILRNCGLKEIPFFLSNMNLVELDLSKNFLIENKAA